MQNETSNSNDSEQLPPQAVYKALPIDDGAKLSMGILYSTVSIYAVLANSLILYFKKKQESQNRNRPQRALSRNVTEIFIHSLAWSDILCAIITFPVTIITFFADVLRYDWVCKSVRYVNFVFPVITAMNLFVIGIERYLGIFYPLIAPSKGTVKKLVVGIWIFGILSAFFPALLLFTSSRHNIGPESYTITCVLNTSLTSIRAMALFYASVQYIIPSIILTITNTHILIFLRRRQRQAKTNDDLTLQGKAYRAGQKSFSRTNTFIMLIFSFILPYLICAFNAGLKAIFNPNLSYTMDYIMRHTCGFLAYSNSIISPTVMFCCMPDLNRMIREFFSRQILRRKANVFHANVIRPSEVKPKDSKFGLEINEKTKALNMEETPVKDLDKHSFLQLSINEVNESITP